MLLTDGQRLEVQERGHVRGQRLARYEAGGVQGADGEPVPEVGGEARVLVGAAQGDDGAEADDDGGVGALAQAQQLGAGP